MSLPKLGVNIDHIATLRQLRGTPYPGILEAAQIVEVAGGDQITVHLREDRRHIQDEDVKILRAKLKIPLNLEMAATDAMVRFATRVRPDWSCIVPEKRQELTTEGGLNVEKNAKRISSCITRLKKAGIRVSLFIEPSLAAVKLSAELGADAVEFHTGRFCLKGSKAELERIRKAAELAIRLKIVPHAGHGFDYENVRRVAALGLIEEYNIGHSIVCRAAIVGLERAVREMISSIQAP
ncbi:MAG: pyridoxine 5'-phosphate synthase [Oligoflexia bacterium]|nr:pyridoxine 5'-phosphate synthase [Oligoflexia bacterium]